MKKVFKHLDFDDAVIYRPAPEQGPKTKCQGKAVIEASEGPDRVTRFQVPWVDERGRIRMIPAYIL